ncbi:hypothetical protein JL720_2029 [Aureococcus anophagefferens]|nr:hypothetical protein JL720_2029 [Aureococcus anophagefferens]
MNVPGYVPAGFVRKPRSPQDDELLLRTPPPAAPRATTSRGVMTDGSEDAAPRAVADGRRSAPRSDAFGSPPPLLSLPPPPPTPPPPSPPLTPPPSPWRRRRPAAPRTVADDRCEALLLGPLPTARAIDVGRNGAASPCLSGCSSHRCGADERLAAEPPRRVARSQLAILERERDYYKSALRSSLAWAKGMQRQADQRADERRRPRPRITLDAPPGLRRAARLDAAAEHDAEAADPLRREAAYAGQGRRAKPRLISAANFTSRRTTSAAASCGATRTRRARFFTDAASRGVGRALLEDRRAPFEHFFPRNLFLSAVHAVAFTAAPALAAATPGPDAPDDEELLDWEKLAEELKDFKQRAAAMLVRVLGCTSLKRALEAACVKYCALPTADKLVKDASKSALRKAARHGRLGASYRMLATAAYANALSYVSNLAVEEACFLAQYTRETKADPRAELAHRRKLKKQSAAALVGYGAAYTFATRVCPAPSFLFLVFFRRGARRLGMALGTVVKPGWGTVIGGAFGDLLGILLL